MQELTAEQKTRQIITGSPFEEPHFEHEGSHVVRWITGGNQPDLHVTFEQEAEGECIFVRCATCQVVLGYMPKEGDQAASLAEMRQAGHEHT